MEMGSECRQKGHISFGLKCGVFHVNLPKFELSQSQVVFTDFFLNLLTDLKGINIMSFISDIINERVRIVVNMLMSLWKHIKFCWL